MYYYVLLCIILDYVYSRHVGLRQEKTRLTVQKLVYSTVVD